MSSQVRSQILLLLRNQKKTENVKRNNRKKVARKSQVKKMLRRNNDAVNRIKMNQINNKKHSRKNQNMRREGLPILCGNPALPPSTPSLCSVRHSVLHRRLPRRLRRPRDRLQQPGHAEGGALLQERLHARRDSQQELRRHVVVGI